MPPALPTGAIVASTAWNIPVLKKCSSVVRRSTSDSCEPGGVSTSDTQRGSTVACAGDRDGDFEHGVAGPRLRQ